MHSEVAWVLVFSGAQVQPQMLLDPDYVPDYIPFLVTMKKLIIKTLKGLTWKYTVFVSDFYQIVFWGYFLEEIVLIILFQNIFEDSFLWHIEKG